MRVGAGYPHFKGCKKNVEPIMLQVFRLVVFIIKFTMQVICFFYYVCGGESVVFGGKEGEKFPFSPLLRRQVD